MIRQNHYILLTMCALVCILSQLNGQPAESGTYPVFVADGVRIAAVSAADTNTANSANALPDNEPGDAPGSHAVNLACVRSLKKPVFRPMGDPADMWERDFLTGDWGGTRTWLWDNGVEIAYAHFVDIYNNTGGRNNAFFSANPAGPKNGTSLFNVGVLSIDLDFDRMGLWDDGFLHLTTAATSGSSMEYEYVGSLNPNSYYSNGFADYFKLFELFYEHKFDQNRIAIRAGQIYPYVMTGACGASCLLQNGSFQYPTFIGTTSNNGYGSGLGPAFIGTSVGTQVRYMPDSRWTFIGQIMDGYADPSGGFATGNTHGVAPLLSMDEGAEIILQASYRINKSPGDPVYPGTYSAGIQLHTGMFAHKYENEAGQSLPEFGGHPKLLSGNREIYFIGEQMLWRNESNQKSVTSFAKFALAPDDRNTVSFHAAWGISVSGVVAGRQYDALTIGYSYTRLSDTYRKTLLSAGGDATYESVLELSYTATISPWFMLRPTIQWIHNPFGADVETDPLVAGLCAGISL